MSKHLLPSTPDTLPLYIAEKLDALGTNPKEEDLEAIRILLYTYQEERVISDEELQEWKKSEKKILENQNEYKKNTENSREYVKYGIPSILLYILPVSFCVRILRCVFAAGCPSHPFALFDCWPIDLIVVAIYLYHFHSSELKSGTANPIQHEVAENNDNDDDDWEGSLTSSELQSRQKALVREWERIMKECSKRLESPYSLWFARFAIMIYFVIYACHSLDCLHSEEPFEFSLLKTVLLVAEYMSVAMIFLKLFIQFLIETSYSLSPKQENDRKQ